MAIAPGGDTSMGPQKSEIQIEENKRDERIKNIPPLGFGAK